jgi:hypothetical protein
VLIKALLLAGIATFGVLALRGSHTATRRALWRLAGLGVLLVGAVSVLVPDTLTWAAHRLGIGRGADLLLYVLAVTFLLVVAGLYRRLADLEQRYVALARSIALGPADEAATAPPSSLPANPAA